VDSSLESRDKKLGSCGCCGLVGQVGWLTGSLDRVNAALITLCEVGKEGVLVLVSVLAQLGYRSGVCFLLFFFVYAWATDNPDCVMSIVDGDRVVVVDCGF
jgi:hypothetical protein